MHYKNIPLDKVYHFVAGLAIAFIVTWYLGSLYGLIAGIVAGALKEALDEYRYSGADFFDFFATLAGTFLGIILSNLIQGI